MESSDRFRGGRAAKGDGAAELRVSPRVKLCARGLTLAKTRHSDAYVALRFTSLPHLCEVIAVHIGGS